MAAQTVEELQEAFFNFDLDKDGYITIDDLRLILTNEGEPIPDIEDFLAEANQFSDGHGNVEYKSFAECMLSNDD